MERQYQIILAAVSGALLLLCAYLQSTDGADTIDIDPLHPRNLRVTSFFEDPKSIAIKAYPDSNAHTLALASGVTHKFLMPTDVDTTAQRYAVQNTGLVYVRDQDEINAHSIMNDGRCASTIEVLAWLMDEVNARMGTLILTYGGLIRLYREKDFVNPKTGEYYDDDFDLWSSLETLEIIGSLEKMFFEKFGWSIRFFTNGDYILFVQVFATCGHRVSTRGKSKSDGEVGLEIYPLSVMPVVPRDKGVQSGGDKAKSLWEGSQFPLAMVYPTKRVDFQSVGSSKTLHLQVPNDPFGVLRCLYGTWEVPSSKHVRAETDCTDFYSRDDTM